GDPEVGSEWDCDALTQTLAALSAEAVEVPGYTPDEVAALIQQQAGIPAQEPEPPGEFQEFNESIPTEHQCPKCGYRWSGSSAPKGAANE
ncbi:MAG: hypothetical protein ACM359_18055, partial [Bacillota bacterium]